MKTSILLFIVYVMCACTSCTAQTTKTNSSKTASSKKDTVKQMNLLDEQTKILGQAFTLGGLSDGENPTGGADNYLEMINKLGGSEELKAQLKEIYELYDTSLDPQKKEELKIKVTKMLEESMAKAQSPPNN